MEMRKVEIEYPHYDEGERVRPKHAPERRVGMVVKTNPPGLQHGASVVVHWDGQSVPCGVGIESIEPLPEPPITDAERMAAIMDTEYWSMQMCYAKWWIVTTPGHIGKAYDTALEAVDAFVRWKRGQG